MDADNGIGAAGMASLAPALERMPQLTSLDLKSARIGIGRGMERLGLRHGASGCVACCVDLCCGLWMRCAVVC